MRTTIFLLGLLCLSTTLIAQIPAGYYTNAEGKVEDDLKAALHAIIKGHTEYSYSSSSTDTWDILKEADADSVDQTKVNCIYSGFKIPASIEYNSGDGWNREHVWAKSRGDFGTSRGAGTDCHHLRAADISTNSARSNRSFDYADNFYTDQSGTYSGATDSKTSSSAFIWEPRDEVKGDIARAIFYMATRYEGTDGELDLEVVEELQDNGSKAPLHAKLSVLLEWHAVDPVDNWERRRNDVVYSYQNNRNPFVDHPEYVDRIWNYDGSGGGGEGGTEISCASLDFNASLSVNEIVFTEDDLQLNAQKAYALQLSNVKDSLTVVVPNGFEMSTDYDFSSVYSFGDSIFLSANDNYAISSTLFVQIADTNLPVINLQDSIQHATTCGENFYLQLNVASDNILGTAEQEYLPKSIIYPNPVVNHIQWSVGQNASISLIDAEGRQVLKEVSQKKADRTIRLLAAGTYLLIVKEGTNHYYQRFIRK